MSADRAKPAVPDWGIPFLKADTAPLEFLEAPLPREVVLPLQQHIGVPAEPLVAVGDRVLTGQPIARMPPHTLGAGVHASISGEVTAIGPAAVPGRGLQLCVTVRGDGSDERWPDYKGHERPLRLSTSDLRHAVIEGGIVGLGGATFPTGLKLNRGGGVETLILNGAECEPRIRCDEALMQHEAEAILLGAQIMLRVIEADECIVAIKQDMHGALEAVGKALETLGDDRFRIARVPEVYPVGGEPQLIELLTGREIPSGGLPWDSGAICQNVGTALAVARFLTTGEPLIRRIVSVTGEGVARACAIDVRLGTPLSALVELAGGFTGTEHRLIMGGPMMGLTLEHTELPVTKATNSLYVAAPGELAVPEPERPCIRCGACSDACPVRLMPQLLHRAGRVRDFDRLEELGLKDCIECGVCDYVCPSRIPLVEGFAADKHALWERARERKRAENAAQRQKEREARLAREAEAEQSALADAPADSRAALEELLRRTDAKK